MMKFITSVVIKLMVIKKRSLNNVKNGCKFNGDENDILRCYL